MMDLLEKYKSIFQIFSFMPLAHFGMISLAGEHYRRNYPVETFLQVNQSPWVVLVGLITTAVGLFTLGLLVVHAYRNGSFNKVLRVLWIGNLVLFGVFSIPVYFYRFIMRPVDPLIQELEIRVALKFSSLFLFASGMIFFYQVILLKPYLLVGSQ